MPPFDVKTGEPDLSKDVLAQLRVAEALTSAVFDELDTFGAGPGLALVLWKIIPNPSSISIEGRIDDDALFSTSQSWASALGMTEQSDGGNERRWVLADGPWRVVITATSDAENTHADIADADI